MYNGVFWDISCMLLPLVSQRAFRLATGISTQ